jgi:hypothetical protein
VAELIGVTCQGVTALALYRVGTVGSNARTRGSRDSAVRLVDDGALRRVPGDLAGDVARVCVARPGAGAGADVRTVASVAASDGEALGRAPASSFVVADLLRYLRKHPPDFTTSTL